MSTRIHIRNLSNNTSCIKQCKAMRTVIWWVAYGAKLMLSDLDLLYYLLHAADGNRKFGWLWQRVDRRDNCHVTRWLTSINDIVAWKTWMCVKLIFFDEDCRDNIPGRIIFNRASLRGLLVGLVDYNVEKWVTKVPRVLTISSKM